MTNEEFEAAHEAGFIEGLAVGRHEAKSATDWTALRHQYAGQAMAAKLWAGFRPDPIIVLAEVDKLIAALKETKHD